jgi:head-tail adaptor
MTIKLPETGELQRRINIRLWEDIPNAAFGLDQTVDAGIWRYAKVDPVNSISNRYGAQTEEMPTHMFWVYYGPGTRPEEITAAHVVEWNNRRYRILGALNPLDAQIFTRIDAKDLGSI